jgi:hypothetical protein
MDWKPSRFNDGRTQFVQVCGGHQQVAIFGRQRTAAMGVRLARYCLDVGLPVTQRCQQPFSLRLAHSSNAMA